jgi:hypothetical protein
MASLRERWIAWLTQRRRLRQVKRLESLIGRWMRRYQCDVDKALRDLGIRILTDRRNEFDPIKGIGVVLTFKPSDRRLYLHASSDSCTRRLAMGMLVIHLAVTKAGQDWAKLPLYTVCLTDLTAAEGPSDNERWMEYMQAIDLLLPMEVFEKLRRECIVHGYQNQTTYVLQRVMGVSIPVLRQRTADSMRDVHPVSSANTVQDLISLPKSRTVHVNTTAQHR